jgi:hypothetical protein
MSDDIEIERTEPDYKALYCLASASAQVYENTIMKIMCLCSNPHECEDSDEEAGCKARQSFELAKHIRKTMKR